MATNPGKPRPTVYAPGADEKVRLEVARANLGRDPKLRLWNKFWERAGEQYGGQINRPSRTPGCFTFLVMVVDGGVRHWFHFTIDKTSDPERFLIVGCYYDPKPVPGDDPTAP